MGGGGAAAAAAAAAAPNPANAAPASDPAHAAAASSRTTPSATVFPKAAVPVPGTSTFDDDDDDDDAAAISGTSASSSSEDSTAAAATNAAPAAATAAAANAAPAPVVDKRLGDSALYAFVYPNFMVNRYGPWMDTNWVVPTGPDSCVVVFDYYLEPDLAGDAAFIEESLAASDLVRKKGERGGEGEFFGLTTVSPQLGAPHP